MANLVRSLVVPVWLDRGVGFPMLGRVLSIPGGTFQDDGGRNGHLSGHGNE